MKTVTNKSENLCPTFSILFLRGCKFSLERTKEKLDFHFTVSKNSATRYIIYRVVFYLFLPIFRTKMKKNKLQPTRALLPIKFQCKTAPHWLGKLFHFSTENREEQIKQTPCKMYICAQYINCRCAEVCRLGLTSGTRNRLNIEASLWHSFVGMGAIFSCFRSVLRRF